MAGAAPASRLASTGRVVPSSAARFSGPVWTWATARARGSGDRASRSALLSTIAWGRSSRPGQYGASRIFYYNSLMRGVLKIPQISAVMGPCVAGGAYLPIMSDEALIVEGTGSIFLAGPFLVRAAIGEQIDTEALGGAEVQTDVSMVVDDRFPDDAACLAPVRERLAQLAVP